MFHMWQARRVALLPAVLRHEDQERGGKGPAPLGSPGWELGVRGLSLPEATLDNSRLLNPLAPTPSGVGVFLCAWIVAHTGSCVFVAYVTPAATSCSLRMQSKTRKFR